MTHVIGPNGSGKSTLLEAISVGDGYKGDIARRAGFVGSHYARFIIASRLLVSKRKTCFLQLGVPILALSQAKLLTGLDAEINTALDEISQMLDITDKLHRSIQTLSGGEWQR